MVGVGRDGIVYGLLCFVAGFVFGVIREMVLIPAFGSRLGHAIEFPLVTLAAVAIAWWLVARAPRHSVLAWLCAGIVGVATLLALESTLALVVLGMPLADYLEGYDLTQGALFPVGLAVMLAAPVTLAAFGKGRGVR